MANGQGVMIWPDGSSYEGLWSYNSADGQGVFIADNGQTVQGDWNFDGKLNGHHVSIKTKIPT